MQLLINIMIYLGSGLMVYNIIRYSAFVREMRSLDAEGHSWGALSVPLVLLVFFLIGYLVVAVSGTADLMMAGILLGGSIFVFLLLTVMYSIIDRVRDTDRVLAVQYDEMRAELRALGKSAAAAFLVNLTRDEVMDRAGEFLYDSDLKHDAYSELLAARQEHVISTSFSQTERSLFQRDGLLKHYQSGQPSASEVLLVRRRDGLAGFVRFEAKLTKMPVNGDVVALITERPCNADVIHQVLLDRVLTDQYDRVAYLIDGSYHPLVGSGEKGRDKKGLLLPGDAEDSYESLYLNDILPALSRGRGHTPGQSSPLRLSVIDAAMAKEDRYELTENFALDGGIFRKKLVFYRIDRGAKFYLLLLSDAAEAAPEPAPEKAEPEKAPEPAPEKAPEKAPEPAPAPAAAPAGPAVPPLHILLVDDNELNREIGQLALTSEGHQVDLAQDGGQAVERIASSAPGAYDVVLMDVQMPVLNGYEATAKIRALPDPALAAIPIIAVTANAYPEDVRAALDAGMDGHVVKPITPDALHAALRSVLDKQREG